MKIILNGNFEKSILLSNQQETFNIIKGSSETYTQSSLFDIKLSALDSAKPTHIKKYNKDFID